MRQDSLFGRRLLLSGVIGLALSITGVTASALEPLDIDGKEHLWKGVHKIRQHTDFECGDMKATFEAEIAKDKGVRIVTATVNGKQIPAPLIEEMEDRIKPLGYFDYVYFICAGDSYRFSFDKWEANQSEPKNFSVSGRLKDLEP